MCRSCTSLSLGRPTKVAAEQALLNDADKRKIENSRESQRAMNKAARSIRAKITREAMKGATGFQLTQVVRDAMQEAQPVIRKAGVLGDLSGRRRTVIRAEGKGQKIVKALAMRNPGVQLATFSEAAAFLRARSGVSYQDFLLLSDRYGQLAAAALAGTTRDVDKAVTNAVFQNTIEGLTGPNAAARIAKAMQSVGLTATKPALIETIHRTQTAVAYTAGRVAATAIPEIQSILWGYEYVTVGDDRVRPSHEALEGVRMAKDDPFWNRFRPPNGFNCRCDVIEIFVDEQIATEVTPPSTVEFNGKTVEVQPDKGFGFDPGNLFRDILGVAS